MTWPNPSDKGYIVPQHVPKTQILVYFIPLNPGPSLAPDP